MKSLLLLALTLVSPPPVSADQTNAYCSFSPHDHSMEMVTGPCIFQQYQGTIHVGMNDRWFHFPSTDQDITYRRTNRREGIWLHRDEYSLIVLWEKPPHEPGGF